MATKQTTFKQASVETVWVPARFSTIPSAGRVEAAPPAVRISEGGQLSANTKATAVLGSKEAMNFALLMFNPTTRTVRWQCFATLPEKIMAKYELTEADFRKIVHSDKAKTDNIYVGAGAWLRTLGYDFAASGSQKFQLTGSDEQRHYVEFTLPEGAMAPTVKVPRKRRAKTATTPAAGATTPATAPAPPNLDEDDE